MFRSCISTRLLCFSAKGDMYTLYVSELCKCVSDLRYFVLRTDCTATHYTQQPNSLVSRSGDDERIHSLGLLVDQGRRPIAIQGNGVSALLSSIIHIEIPKTPGGRTVLFLVISRPTHPQLGGLNGRRDIRDIRGAGPHGRRRPGWSWHGCWKVVLHWS